jgi:tetratricopeptide (TPR) repeat protein
MGDAVAAAMAELEGGDESVGIDRLGRAHASAPEDPWLLVVLGRAERQYGNLEAARRYLLQAAAVAPDLPCAHSELAVVTHRLGQDEEAKAAVALALTMNPSDAAAQAVLADLSGARPCTPQVERVEADSEFDGNLDQWPAADELIGGLVDVQGWVVSRRPETVEVRVLVDGCAWPAWITPLFGPDVVQAFAASPPSNPMPRFHLLLDTRTIPDGRHVLTFVALCGGRMLNLGERPVVIRNRELMGVADGPAGEWVEHLVRERDAMRLDLEGRLDALARERDAQRLELEGRLDALARERDAQRLELEGRLDALAQKRDAERLELEERLDALARQIEAVGRERDALAHALNLEIERLVRERDEATAQLRRMLDTWPVRLYARAVRLPGAATLMRRIVGVRR